MDQGEWKKINYLMAENMSTFDLVKLANMRMPFGKYTNWHLIDLPETYLIWFSHKGFPKGELGDMLKSVLEIKTNGLDHLLLPLKNKSAEKK